MGARTLETCVNVLGVAVDPFNMESALARIQHALQDGEAGYVSVVGVHGIMAAQRDPQLASILAGSTFTIPDGMPTVWVGHLQGHKEMERVAGPDLMLEMFRRPEFVGYKHFLCGGNEGVAEELAVTLRARFPWTKIVGTYMPPFRNLTEAEEDELVAHLQASQADILWVGISTPKQEMFMQRMLPKLHGTMMFGVGAAFDYHTGRIRDCSEWIKRAGLQWLHRLLQDPRRLWRRYLRNNPAFLFKIALQLSGMADFPLVEAPAVLLPEIEVATEFRYASGPNHLISHARLQSNDNSLTGV